MRGASPFCCRALRGIFCAKNLKRCLCDRAAHTAVRGMGEKRIAKRGDPMEKKEVRREDVIEALKEIAFGRVNCGVELAYLEDPTAERIRKMDLSTVAEFKRGANGAVEIKFVDRVKALGALYEMLGGGDENEAAEFLQALEQAGEEREPWRE